MMKLKAPGMRTIKTSLVVAICLVFSKLLNLHYPYYAVITSIICTQNTLHGSFKVAKNRILGTIVGSILGIFFVYIFSYNPLVSGIGVFILLYFLKMIRLEDAYLIACVVYLATFIPGHGPPIAYGFHRSVATIMGILTALAVNLIVSPPEYADDIEKLSYAFINDLFVSCARFFSKEREIDLTRIGSEIVKIEDMIKNYKLDIEKSNIKSFDVERLDYLMFNSKKLYNHLGIINELNKLGYSCTLDEENANYINKLYNQEITTGTCEKTCHDEVFNYHIKKLIEYLDKFKDSKVGF